MDLFISVNSNTMNFYLQKSGEFVYKTSRWVLACTVMGIALKAFQNPLSSTFLCLAAAATAVRLIIDISPYNNLQVLKNFREKIYLFQEKHFYIHILALTVLIAISRFSSFFRIPLGISLGVYKGLVDEIDFFKHRNMMLSQKIGYENSSIAVKISKK